MPTDYVSPELNASSFTCPQCGVVAHMTWFTANWKYNEGNASTGKLSRSECAHCGQSGLWDGSALVYPTVVIGPEPVDDMPGSVLEVYEEARRIAGASPRAAAAMLRLSIELVCREVGCTGNLDAMIGQLVERGLRRGVSDALDVVRVVGNDAVHTGEIQLEDDAGDATVLFGIVNLIVQQIITEPKQVDGLLDSLPASKRERIEKRHSP